MARGKGGFSPLGAVGTVRTFVEVMREISFDDERRQAEHQPTILVLAPDQASAESFARTLIGSDLSTSVTTAPFDGGGRAVDDYDVVLVLDGGRGALDNARRRSGKGGSHVFSASTGTEQDTERLRVQLAKALPDLAPALGRWYPAFERAAVRAVIEETARVNAQFALVSNAPSIIPVIGSLASAGADFLVITKNQLMLIFKLAAIHRRDLRDHWSLIREMLPVVGAGLAWRTVAREAASFLPLLAGTIPKVAIAFTGTMTAGWAADFYYRFGRKPSRDQWKGYYEQAAGNLKDALPFISRDDPKPNGGVIDIEVKPPTPEPA
jgi:uncharacterized protein (DUF697 family)